MWQYLRIYVKHLLQSIEWVAKRDGLQRVYFSTHTRGLCLFYTQYLVACRKILDFKKFLISSLEGKEGKITYRRLCSMLTLKITAVLIYQLINCYFKNRSVAKNWHTYAYKYKQILIRKHCIVVYWWLNYCTPFINAGNCTFLRCVISHDSRNAQIYKYRSKSYE